MLEVLRGEEVDITLSLSSGNHMDAGVVFKKSSVEYSVASNEFVDVEALIVNNSGKYPEIFPTFDIPYY